ncbi:MAG: hypothetical protein DRG11_07560, partial [Epsilonproteobacteria bacterium]
MKMYNNAREYFEAIDNQLNDIFIYRTNKSPSCNIIADHNKDSKLYKVVNEPIYFGSAKEANQYAKNNPGKAVTRNSDAVKYTQAPESVVKKAKLDKSPRMILKYLNKHIISQDEAKKEIALAMYYHSLKSHYSNNKNIGINGPIMIVGPTGSGKTFVVQKACEYIDTVFIHVDTSSMVPEGIVGYSIGDLGKDILKKADYNIHKASHCVVFFDEMDKLFSSEDASDYGDRVASQLLRLIEGTKIKLSNDLIEKI